ncbi:MAG TPA: hypothetical protein VF490_08530 [Chryseosolibacter sp.]
MRKKRLHTVTIMVGSILALAIAFSQYLTPDCMPSAEKVKTEKSGKADHAGDHTASYFSLPSFSLPTPVDVQANLSSYCLFEILLEEDIDENRGEENLFYPDRLFETMFRVIISPNAP